MPALLKDLRRFVLVGAKPPVAFFAYPGKPSLVSPPGAVMTSPRRSKPSTSQ